MALLDLLWAVLAVQVCALLYRYYKYRRYWSDKLADIVGPSYPLPLIGHLMRVFGPLPEILDRGLAVYREFGPLGRGGPIKFWVGEYPCIQVMRPEDIEPIMSSAKEVQKPDLLYKPVQGFFGNGLITLSNETWYRHRRVLTPAFHFKVLEKYAGIFTERSAMFAAKIGPLTQGKSFDITKHLSALVTETVTETAFGITGKSKEELRDVEHIVTAMDKAVDLIMVRIMQPWLLVDFLYRLSPWFNVHKKSEEIIFSFAKKVIGLKRKEVEVRHTDGAVATPTKVAEDDVGIRQKFTFLDLVLEHNTDLLTDDEIMHEVRTLIAVQETSSATLGFIMLMLALHPDVQERARQEVLEVDEDALSLEPLERLQRFKYLERVIKETLRLYPIVPFFGRTLKEDVKLPEHTLPAGVGVNMFIYLTHRDPRHWKDPDTFDPDRFLPENCVGRHPFAYVPFSAGPRNCIGQRYAMLQMKAISAAMLKRYTVLPGDGCERMDKIRLAVITFLYVTGGCNVRLEPRSPDADVDSVADSVNGLAE